MPYLNCTSVLGKSFSFTDSFMWCSADSTNCRFTFKN